MSDYTAESPLWDRQGMVEPEDRGLSAELAASLRSWEAHFEAHFDHESGWDSEAARRWYADQVEGLASQLRTELGPDVELELVLWPLNPPQPSV